METWVTAFWRVLHRLPHTRTHRQVPLGRESHCRTKVARCPSKNARDNRGFHGDRDGHKAAELQSSALDTGRNRDQGADQLGLCLTKKSLVEEKLVKLEESAVHG
jgi:hypothetical protein